VSSPSGPRTWSHADRTRKVREVLDERDDGEGPESGYHSTRG
jgi:hypothetical protein